MARREKPWTGRRLVQQIERHLEPFGRAKLRSRRRGAVVRPGFEVLLFGDTVHVFYKQVAANLSARERDDNLAAYKRLLEESLPPNVCTIQFSGREYLPPRILISLRG